MISVIVATYNSKLCEIICTLNSILFQKNVETEIIIADDGSTDNHFSEIADYLDENLFFHYQLLGDNINRGTCENVFHAVCAAKGNYIKLISPGDFLYDATILYNWQIFMEKSNVDVSFSDTVYYALNDNYIHVIQKATQPSDPYFYLNDKYKRNDAIKHYLLYSDRCVGASFLTKTKIIKDYLELIHKGVKLAEDNIYRVMVCDGIRFGFYHYVGVIYQCGNGVSTSHNMKYIQVMNSDFEYTDSIICKRLGNSIFERKVKRYLILLHSNNVNKLSSKFFRLILFPQFLLWRVRDHFRPRLSCNKLDNPFIQTILKNQNQIRFKISIENGA